MPKNYLIGIGGTGARIIEAVTYMCAAGYGPDRLNVFIIDPDEGNGNLIRTQDLLSLYGDCRKEFVAEPGTSLFKTDIRFTTPLVWNIFPSQNATLGYYINHKAIEQKDKDLAAFISLLYSEQELSYQLNEGFRGHPSIGAAVMSNPPMDQQPWKAFWDDVSDGTPYDARVFLAGSIFGGTGAAGVPTLGAAEILKRNERVRLPNNASNIHLGGALILPYFEMVMDKEAEEIVRTQMCVTQHNFPIATKAALSYYNEKELEFDELYFIGDAVTQKVGLFRPGAAAQRNMPHYVEVVAALSAFDFFDQPVVESEPEKRYFTAARENQNVSWNQLPVTRHKDLVEKKQNDFKAKMVCMTAFSYLLCSYGKDILKQEHKRVLNTWYRRNFNYSERDPKSRMENIRAPENSTRIDTVSRLANWFLGWISAMDSENGNVLLVNRQKIVKGDVHVGAWSDLVDPMENKLAIGTFLREESKQLGFEQMLHMLDQTVVNNRSISGANRFINLLYQGASAFCSSNYQIR